jgi:hypothetical protein
MIKKLKDYKNQYQGKQCVLIGSGPTKFNYENLTNFNCPIFFINDTIRFEKFSIKESFLFTHHPNKFKNLVQKSTFFYPERYLRRKLDDTIWAQNESGIHNGNYVYPKEITTSPCVVYYDILCHCSHIDWERNNNVKDTGFPDWAFDKDECIKRNSLFGHTGTITTLIHFLWFSGFEKTLIIGCNPIFRDEHRHDTRITSLTNRKGSLFDLKAIIENQKAYLKTFELSHEYIGDYNYGDLKML